MILLCTDSLLYTTNPLQIARQSHLPDEITMGESAPSEQSGVWDGDPESISIKVAGNQEFVNAPSEQSGSSEVKED
jgi:hypothetical protein